MGYGSDNSSASQSDDSDNDDDDDINAFYSALPAVDPEGNESEDTVDLRVPGAEHLLVLLDCNPDMFVPSVPFKQKRHRHFDYEEDERESEFVGKWEEEEEDKGTGGTTMKHEDSNRRRRELITPIDAVLQSLQALIRQTVRDSVKTKSGKRNGFGLTLFNTKKRTRLPIWQDLYHNERRDRYNNNSSRFNGNSGSSDSEDDDSHQEDKSDSDSDSDNSNNNNNSRPRGSKSTRASAETTVHDVILLDPPGSLTIKSLRQCLPDPNHNFTRKLDLQQEFMDANSSTMVDGKDGTQKTGTASSSESFLKAIRDIPEIFRDASCVAKARKAHEKIRDDTKTIWIFTNRDNPVANDSDPTDQMNVFQNTASDYERNGYKLKVFPLPNANSKSFHMERFFDKFAKAPDILLRNLEHYSSKSDGDFDLDLTQVLEGHWKIVRRAYLLPLVFPDQLLAEKSVTTSAIKSEEGLASASPTNKTQDDLDEADDERLREERERKIGIMLDFFSPVHLQTEPPKIKILREVDEEDHVELERVHYHLLESSGERLAIKKSSDNSKEAKDAYAAQPGLDRIRTFHSLGKKGNFIPISRAEIAELKRRSNASGVFPSLVLLGFKKAVSVPFHHNLKTYFVYPNESIVDGSTAAFAHLHQSMLKKNVVGIGELLVRKTGTSRLVAIHAMEEEFEEIDDEDSDNSEGGKTYAQSYPPGWIVNYLPFENEFRAMPADESFEEDFEVSPEVLAATGTLMKEMFGQECDLARYVNFTCMVCVRLSGFKFRLTLSPAIVITCSDFKNPYLEKFWDYVESVVMEEEMPVEKDYTISPIDDEALRKMTDLVKTLTKILPKDEEKKRKADEKPSASDETDWLAEYQAGNLPRYKIDDLKLGLKNFDEKLSGKKEVLVERLCEAIRRAHNLI